MDQPTQELHLCSVGSAAPALRLCSALESLVDRYRNVALCSGALRGGPRHQSASRMLGFRTQRCLVRKPLI